MAIERNFLIECVSLNEHRLFFHLFMNETQQCEMEIDLWRGQSVFPNKRIHRFN